MARSYMYCDRLTKGVDLSIFKRSKTEKIEVHLSPADMQLLVDGACASHKNFNEFLLDAGVAAAYKALADRQRFVLNDEQLDAFQKVLKRPLKEKPR